MSTRPTADRVKESLFSILNGLISFEDRSVLDLFAGSGALGLEALSRGAASALFIDRSSTGIIRDNLERSKLEGGTIVRGDVFRVLERLSDQKSDPKSDQQSDRNSDRNSDRQSDPKFDLIFVDPPYHFGLAQRALDLIVEKNFLSAEGLISIEFGADEKIISDRLESVRKINYGRTTSIEIFGRKT